MADVVERALLGLTLVALLVSPLLVSYGQTTSVDTLWWAGLGLIVVAGAVPTLARYAFDGPENDEE